MCGDRAADDQAGEERGNRASRRNGREVSSTQACGGGSTARGLRSEKVGERATAGPRILNIYIYIHIHMCIGGLRQRGRRGVAYKMNYARKGGRTERGNGAAHEFR